MSVAPANILQPGEIVPVDEFMRRARITRWTLARMRGEGLKTRKSGHQVYVRYDDFDEYTKNLPVA